MTGAHLLRKRLPALVNCGLLLAFIVAGNGCRRSKIKEHPITGRASDAPAALQSKWQPDQRYVYHVDAITSTQVPRRNSSAMIRAEVSIGQDLAFSVTNVAPDGSKVVLMEVQAVTGELATDDVVKMSYDSQNQSGFLEENPLATRLQKMIGARLVFHLTPENTVKRVDGTKEFNSKTSGSGPLRGVASSVVNRFFNVPFFREIVEMSMLPKTPVKVGEEWKVTRPASGGLLGAGSMMETTYTFRGWQVHDGTNCARIDFTGAFRPPARTNQSVVRQVVASVVPPNSEEGTVKGKSWYEPDVGLAVETIIEQNFKSFSTNVRRVRTPGTGNTNASPVDTTTVALEDIEITTPPASGGQPATPPPAVAGTNAPPPIVTTNSTSSSQQIVIKLVELGTVAPPPPKR